MAKMWPIMVNVLYIWVVFCWSNLSDHFIQLIFSITMSLLSFHLSTCCFCCSIPKLYLTLCNPMDCSTPGLLVLHYLPQFAQTHVHPITSASVAPFSSCPQAFPAPGFFPMSRLFASSDQSIGASTSASVLPMNTQCGKVMSLLLNTLSRLVTDFLPRSKCLLISWLQSQSAVILETKK